MSLSLTKMLINQNMRLTFEEVYTLFYNQFPHVRYVDDKYELYNALKLLHFRDNKHLEIILMNENVIRANKEKDRFTLVDDSILLNDTHRFKVYSKPLTNNELLNLIIKDA